MRYRFILTVLTTALLFISIAGSAGCQGAQLEKLKDGIRQADDGLTAAQAGIDAALVSLPADDTATRPVLARAKPYVDKAQPQVKQLREAVDSANDIPGLIRGAGQWYQASGLPYGEIAGGAGLVLSTVLGLFWRKERKKAVNIVKSIEAAKAEDGMIDFNDSETLNILNKTMNDGAKALVAKVTA